MSESEIQSHAPHVSSHASEFVTRWAEYTRASAFYPTANPRVVGAMKAMIEHLPRALREVGGVPEAGLQVLFPTDRIVVGAVEYEVPPSSPAMWLSLRIHRAALAGVAFLTSVDAEVLDAFTRRLLMHYQRSDLDPTFEKLWPDLYPGIRLLDRRFEGYFDPTANKTDEPCRVLGAGGGSEGEGEAPYHEVASIVSSHPIIQDRMSRLRVQFDAHAAGDETKSIDVLATIADLLPPEAVEDPDRVVRLVESVLHDLEARIEQAATGRKPEALTSEELLKELVRLSSRGILGGGASAQPGIGAGRAGDAGVMDSLGGLREDLANAPPPETGEFSPDSAESPDEQMGVYMHLLVGLEDEERSPALTSHLAGLLGDGNPRRLQTLRSYLEATQGSVDAGFWRLISFLRERDLELLLRTSGFLSPATVVTLFPQHFGIYLEALNPGDSTHRAELTRVLTEVGPKRIRENASDLVDREGVLEEPRVRRLLSDPAPAFLPLLRLVLQHGNDAQRAEAVDLLRRMRIDLLEASLLYIWDDPAGLPLEYLLTIADPERTQQQLEALRPLISAQIVRYLKATDEVPELESRRIYAIQHLGAYFSKDAEVFLDRVVNERKFGVVFKEPKAVREAARRALESGRGTNDGEPSNV